MILFSLFFRKPALIYPRSETLNKISILKSAGENSLNFSGLIIHTETSLTLFLYRPEGGERDFAGGLHIWQPKYHQNSYQD